MRALPVVLFAQPICYPHSCFTAVAVVLVNNYDGVVVLGFPRHPFVIRPRVRHEPDGLLRKALDPPMELGVGWFAPSHLFYHVHRFGS